MPLTRRDFLKVAGATAGISTMAPVTRIGAFRPAMSVPAGFTAEGLPVGIQIVGRYRDELSVFQVAGAFEQATGYGRRRPAIAGDW